VTTSPHIEAVRSSGSPSQQSIHANTGAGTQRFAVSIDPVNLIKQHLLLLILSIFVGTGVGVGSYYAFMRFYPLYRGEISFEFVAQLEDPAAQNTTVGAGGESEIERFIGTQQLRLLSEDVLQQAVNDPQVRDQTRWANQFKSSSGLYNTVEATMELGKIVTAFAVPDTNVVQLRVVSHVPADVATIANAIAGVYLQKIQNSGRISSIDIEESLTNRLNAVREERRLIENRMERLILDNKLVSLNAADSAESTTIRLLLPQMQEIQYELESNRSLLEGWVEQLNAPGGAVYPEDVRLLVKQEPVIQDLNLLVSRTEAELRSSERNFGPNHMQSRKLTRDLESYKERKRAEQEFLMAEIFQDQLDGIQTRIRQLEASEADFLTSLEETSRKLSDIKAILNQYDQDKDEYDRLAEQENLISVQLGQARAIDQRDTANRVTQLNTATQPSQPIFPDILVMTPAGVVLVGGLAFGLIVLKEITEQRVRGPADIAVIPRVRVLGVIPDSAEDSTQPARLERAVFDTPNGILAESFRQLRNTLCKVMNQLDAKVVVCFSGIPGSGASTVIANLASSMALCEMRVLIIDANFRRPAVHKIFGVDENSPGLGTLLTDTVTFDEAVQATDIHGLHLLTAGPEECRMAERLVSPQMHNVLDTIRSRYDVILIDVPPAIVSSDTMTLVGIADCAVLVARAYGEKRGLVARLRNQVEESHTEFAGVIVNAVRSSAGGYYKQNYKTTHDYLNNQSSRRSDSKRVQDDVPPPGVHVNGTVHYDNEEDS
jgi:polysaccharide biosynthesis transport protein